MKPLYIGLIVFVVLVVIFLIYKSKKNKADAERAALAQSMAQQPILPPGGSSGAAQIINSLFPYFAVSAQTGLIGNK